MPLRLLRRILLTSALAVTFVISLPSVARAQAIGVFQEQSLPRVDKDGKTVNKRPITLKPEGVSYQDCADDQRIRFPLQLQTFEGNASLQAWAGLAGTDCKSQQNRTGVARICWPLVTGIQLSVNPIVDIPVRAIMAGVVDPVRYEEVLATGAGMCGNIDFNQISVQFLYFSPGQLAAPTQSKEIAVEVDTVGPAPPTGLRTEPGNGRIKVVWDNISGEGGVSVLTGVRVYCDEGVGGGTTTTDAGTTEPAEASCTEVPNDAGPDADADFDAGTTVVCEEAGTPSSTNDSGTPPTSTTCESANFGEDVIPDKEFNDRYGCGSITGNAGSSATATSLRGQPLKNGVTYAVAVAATDAFNNVGPLSTPKCEYPETTTDFWDNYRKAGGQAGGGCATTGAPIGSMTAMATIGLVALSALRRRWSARRNK